MVAVCLPWVRAGSCRPPPLQSLLHLPVSLTHFRGRGGPRREGEGQSWEGEGRRAAPRAACRVGNAAAVARPAAKWRPASPHAGALRAQSGRLRGGGRGRSRPRPHARLRLAPGVRRRAAYGELRAPTLVSEPVPGFPAVFPSLGQSQAPLSSEGLRDEPAWEPFHLAGRPAAAVGFRAFLSHSWRASGGPPRAAGLGLSLARLGF